MTRRVRLRSGIEITFAGGERFVADGSGDADATLVSHAHGDHYASGSAVVASDLTAALVGARRGGAAPTAVDHPAAELFPAGHVVGSRAMRLTDPDTGRRYLYTGDCSTRDRFHLDGFDPVDADVLILESTYGKPEYRFPSTEESVDAIRSWLAETMDRPVLMFGYALGRAQKLQRLLADSPRDRVFVTDAVADVSDVIEDHRDVTFPGERYGSEGELGAGDALVCSGSPRSPWVESLVESTGAVTAGFSGWAVDDSFVYRRGFDEGFVLTDHCDYDELLALVSAVDPEQVYTQHGFADEFATAITSELGYPAQSLKANQATLGDF
ncbi:MBL fold metallo-hydrolase [Halosimplex salinum]|uniref:mRNA 3'-end processing factor n=1 Tax=Halosimplex salinum TaxID=1710538 RepID=UPI000F474203|nr:mRNA 3'-end processing factor [Halosimplex salinum]